MSVLTWFLHRSIALDVLKNRLPYGVEGTSCLRKTLKTKKVAEKDMTNATRTLCKNSSCSTRALSSCIFTLITQFNQNQPISSKMLMAHSKKKAHFFRNIEKVIFYFIFDSNQFLSFFFLSMQKKTCIYVFFSVVATPATACHSPHLPATACHPLSLCVLGV